MREMSADAWGVDCDVLCITTNCTIKNGRNVMGGGIAKGAADRYHYLPVEYARLIKRHGHHVFLMDTPTVSLLMFPTKNEVWEDSSLDVIEDSLVETIVLANIYGWKNIALPRPGAGLGGLDWHTVVKPFLEDFSIKFDDRFIIVSYPGEK